MVILQYFPIMFVVAFLISIILMTKNYANYKQKLRHKKYIKSINNIEQCMNNNPHITDERKLVESLSKYDITYRGVER